MRCDAWLLSLERQQPRIVPQQRGQQTTVAWLQACCRHVSAEAPAMAGAAAARGTEVKAAPNVVVMQILCSVAAAAPPRCRCTTAQAQATTCALRTICCFLRCGGSIFGRTANKRPKSSMSWHVPIPWPCHDSAGSSRQRQVRPQEATPHAHDASCKGIS